MTRAISRLLTQINAREKTVPRPLSVYFGKPAIVVLGEPGAGKTTIFAEAAAIEPDADYLSVRDFLSLSVERWRARILYLDGLDEQRAKSPDGSSILDQLRGRLDNLGCPRFRLSCRAADWYGSSDIERLRHVSPDRSLTVLNLEPLSDDEVVTIAADFTSDPQGFLQAAKARHVHDLLRNPQTLLMILRVVQEGDWPSSRVELFQRTCDLLARELNEEHARYQAPKTNVDQVLATASAICAVVLCGGARGVALSEASSDRDFPFVGELPGDQAVLSTAARRRVFKTEGSERVIPVHRTVAEYLAARHLLEQVRKGLPVRRAVSLITGYDGGTLSDLRGVFAWLASMLVEHAETLIRQDPLGVVLYGDVAAMPPSLKRTVLEGLARETARNPWFRSEDWAAHPFGGLSSPEMVQRFQSILEDASQHPVFVSCVIDAIRYGPVLPQLCDVLLAVIRDDTRPSFVRADALRAFQHAVADQSEPLVQRKSSRFPVGVG